MTQPANPSELREQILDLLKDRRFDDCEALLEKVSSQSTPALRHACMHYRAVVLSVQRKHDRAETILRALLAEEIDATQRARSLMELAIQLDELGRWQEAEPLYRDAIQLFEVQENWLGAAKAHNNLGICITFQVEQQAADKTRVAEAIEEHGRALSILHSLDDDQAGAVGYETALNHHGLGKAHVLQGNLALAEEALRRFGFGIEASTSDGVNLSGYWLHRNLLGGAERLRVDGAIDRIGAQDTDLGYNLGVRIDRPATPVTDATAFIEARAQRTEVVDQTVDSLKLSFGLTRVLSDNLTAEAGIAYIHSTAKDAAGSTEFDLFALPLSLTWDNRDNPTDAQSGYYLDLDATPFLGLNTTGSGGQIKADARAYRSLGGEGRVVLAGRFQLGTVIGPDLADTPPDFLFFSGGGGTVRGQPYQSLGVPVVKSPTTTIQSGGLSFAGISGELRAGITENIGAVAFYDAGFVSDEGLWGGNGEWHSGAGLGLRYDTGIGPIRLDVAVPVSGNTGDGVQIYIGIGQAF